MKINFSHTRGFYQIVFILAFISSCVSCSSNDSKDTKKEAIVKTIQEELILHPKGTLLDLYKNFFQGRFGPGHMISDTTSAIDYLMQELQNATRFDSVLWQAVGHEKHYYRVNLSLIRDGKIDVGDIVPAFIESANTADQPSIEFWVAEWNSILTIIEQMNINLPNFENDKKQISENLKNGITIGHHSSVYQNNYFPHYRIVSKYHFERLYKMVNMN